MEKLLVLRDDWRLCLIDDADLKGEVLCAAQLEPYGAAVVPATVPGDWPLDYVRAGLMEDPYYQDNYLKIRDYENHHIFYSAGFHWDGSCERTALQFEGIDTLADIYLNGQKIGHANNMFIPHEFAAKSLVEGKNELLVHLYPVALEARKVRLAAFHSAQKYAYEALTVRKAIHMFGWDICPRIVSSGLWRPVSVIQKKKERINDLFAYLTRLDNGGARGRIFFNVDIGREHVKNYALRISGVSRDCRFDVSSKLWYVHGNMGFSIKEPKLWWPRGYGEPSQYEITAVLLRNGEVVDTKVFRQGLRTVELIHDDVIDDDGNGDFCFVVNGRRIYVKGTNWVPADAFHSNDANRIPEILELVKDIGCNAIRIWGGSVYESDFFYEWCDDNGILIWQDFMMACGIYPHTGRMKRQLEIEATAIVRRLRRHASICLWSGDNECDQNYAWYDLPMDPTLNELTRGVIPKVLRAEDQTRPYLPSSPYASAKAFALGKVRETPEQHLWGPRDYFKSPFYHDHNAAFASEMGYHGCNSPQSIYRFIGKARSWPVDDNDLYVYHAASPETVDAGGPYSYRIALMSSHVRYLFDEEPENLDEYARMSQISQAEAKKYFVESFRSKKGRCTGLIWWNIMDCWPQISDAVVDYYFCKKLAYHYIRRSQQPLCLMMDDHTGALALYAVSDLMEARQITYRVTDIDTDEVVASGDAMVAADASTMLQSVLDDGSNRFYAIKWSTEDGDMGVNHYLQGRPKYAFSWYMQCIKKLGIDQFEGF